MFENCVLKVSVDTKEWFKAALIRAIKTMAQTALSLISVGAVMSDINWVTVASASAVAGIYSILTSIGGIPEVKTKAVTEDENPAN